MANIECYEDSPFYERTSKRRKGFPSETRVGKGDRIVHGTKELVEKLGRMDPCPCGSGRRFQELLPAFRGVRWLPKEPLLLGSKDIEGRSELSACLFSRGTAIASGWHLK
ncbi:MAG TPA: SEC-C metal-binding domain-containing protein [Candidatus Dormibacteraeota bacterium]|nr:SEC-C metal-binding domain-containing protein [Candidatus Dormibacteraeota bacterium]